MQDSKCKVFCEVAIVRKPFVIYLEHKKVWLNVVSYVAYNIQRSCGKKMLDNRIMEVRLPGRFAFY